MIPHHRLVRFLKRILIATQLSKWDNDVVEEFINVLWDYGYLISEERHLLLAFKETLVKEKINAYKETLVKEKTNA